MSGNAGLFYGDSRQLKFFRDGAAIRTPGIDFGPLLVRLAGDAREIWKNPGHSVWNGNGRPWRYAATEYWAVEVEAEPATKDGLLIADGLARIVRREEPGKNWRRTLAELTAWVKEGAA